MTKKDIKFIEKSIHHRLLNFRDQVQRPFNEILQHFFIERFLYRLSLSPYQQRFILKGGLMLKVWYGTHARPTKDIDMLAQANNSPANLRKIIQEIISVDVPNDGIIFDPDTIESAPIQKDSEYQGVRVILKGNFAKIPVHIQLDFGFGDLVTPQPQWLDYPQLLNFGTPRLQGYTQETLIAEKYQAMVDLGQYNTRLKDFFDIWLLAQNHHFVGQTLALALATTFQHRNTTIPETSPVALTPVFYQDQEKLNSWKAFLAKSNLAYVEFAQVIQLLDQFLLPPSQALVHNQPFNLVWSPLSYWH